jgi:hypothetical protein
MTTTDAPKPFTLAVPDAALANLREKLKLTQFPTEVAGASPSRGPPLVDLTRLVARWTDEYDWRRREREINKLPMFTRPIAVDGFSALDIHYVHQTSSVQGAIPLLFVHGCTCCSMSSHYPILLSLVDESSVGPGHFLEVEKLLPLLTAASSEHPSFHVVVPSLPGFGFSEYSDKAGFGLDQYAEVCIFGCKPAIWADEKGRSVKN